MKGRNDPLALSVNEAILQSGLAKICDLMRRGVLETTAVDGRRLILYPSLQKLLAPQPFAPLVAHTRRQQGVTGPLAKKRRPRKAGRAA